MWYLTLLCLVVSCVELRRTVLCFHSPPSPKEDHEIGSACSHLERENLSRLQSFSLRLFKKRLASVMASRGPHLPRSSLSNLRQRAQLHYQQAFKTTSSGLSYCENALKEMFESKKIPTEISTRLVRLCAFLTLSLSQRLLTLYDHC